MAEAANEWAFRAGHFLVEIALIIHALDQAETFPRELNSFLAVRYQHDSMQLLLSPHLHESDPIQTILTDKERSR